jgi:hypothetical protein
MLRDPDGHPAFLGRKVLKWIPEAVIGSMR